MLAWLRRVPALLAEHAGEWALCTSPSMEPVAFFSSSTSALDAGYRELGLNGGWMVVPVRLDGLDAEWLARREAAEAEYASWDMAAVLWRPAGPLADVEQAHNELVMVLKAYIKAAPSRATREERRAII